MKEIQVLFLGMWGTAAKTRTKQAQPVGTWDMMVNFKLLDAIRNTCVKYIFIITTHEAFATTEQEDRFNTTMDYMMFSVEEYLKHDMHSACANTLRAVDAMFAPLDGPSAGRVR